MNHHDERAASVRQLIEELPREQRQAWGRLAVLRWFDPAMHEFVVGDRLPFDLVHESAFVQRLPPGVEQARRYRVRDSVRHEILTAQAPVAGGIVRHTAALAAAFLSPDDWPPTEYLGYLYLSDPGAAQTTLVRVAARALKAGEPGSAVTAARDTLYGVRFAEHLGAPARLERDRLARFADVVSLTGGLLTQRPGSGELPGQARLLRIALTHARPLGTGDEQWVLDLAHQLCRRHLQGDEWASAPAYRTDVSSQVHDITVTAAGRIGHRIEAVVRSGGDSSIPLVPTLVTVLPAAAENVADGILVHDETGATVPRLTIGQARRLVTIAEVIETGFPEPGLLARHPERAGATWANLLEASLRPGAGLPVIALLPDGPPGMRALRLSYDLPGPLPSRWTGQVSVNLSPTAVSDAEQHVQVRPPVGMRLVTSASESYRSEVVTAGGVAIYESDGQDIGRVRVRYGLRGRDRVPAVLAAIVPLSAAAGPVHPITAVLFLGVGLYGALLVRFLNRGLALPAVPRHPRVGQILSLAALIPLGISLIPAFDRAVPGILLGASAVLGGASVLIETGVYAAERIRRRPAIVSGKHLDLLSRLRARVPRPPDRPFALTWSPLTESARPRPVRDLAAELVRRPAKVHLLGPPGSGKSALLAFLAAALRGQGRHPWLLPVRSWRPAREPLVRWAVRRVSASRGRRAALTRLIESGRVVLMLDGLDELSTSARLEVLRGVENAGPGVAVVAACRTEEYQAVSPAARGLTSATVIEVDPVAVTVAEETEAVIPRFADVWAGAGFLGTPEAVELAAVVRAGRYQAHDTAEQALADAALRRAYEWGPGGRLTSGQARRWLRTVAVIARRTTHGFAWLDLHRTLTGPARGLLVTLGTGGTIALAAWIGVALSGMAPSGTHRLTVMSLLLLAATVIAAAALTPRKAFTGVRAVAQFAGMALTVAAALHGSGSTPAAAALAAAVVAGGSLVSWPAGWVIRRSISRRRVRQPLDARRSLRVALLFPVLEVLLPLVFAAGAVFVFGQPPMVLPVAAVAGLALPMLFSPWGWYRLSHLVLAARGAVPWRLTRFLEDAAERRVLRHSGMGFDFRHQIYRQGLAPHGSAAPVLSRVGYEVARFFQRHPGDEFDDHGVCAGTGLMPSQTYPALRFLAGRGWLEERWEATTGDRRRFYRVDNRRRDDLDGAVEEFQVLHPTPATSLRARPAGVQP